MGCLALAYADSLTPISAERFRFSDSPEAIAGFERGVRALETLSCDILITPHAGASSFWERLEKGREGLIDRGACRKYAAAARQQLGRRMDGERRPR